MALVLFAGRLTVDKGAAMLPVIARKIAPARRVVCAAPDYLTRHGIPRTPQDLANHNCLSLSQSPWSNEWRFTGPEGDVSIRVSGNLETNSANALRRAAAR